MEKTGAIRQRAVLTRAIPVKLLLFLGIVALALTLKPDPSRWPSAPLVASEPAA